MNKKNFTQEKLTIDKIIDTALKKYKEELEKSEIKEWTFDSQKIYIEETFEKYNRESISYINQIFNEGNKDENLNIFNYNSRLLLYYYAGKRDCEFESIKKDFIQKLNNI